jgi:hypothetical protein
MAFKHNGNNGKQSSKQFKGKALNVFLSRGLQKSPKDNGKFVNCQKTENMVSFSIKN